MLSSFTKNILSLKNKTATPVMSRMITLSALPGEPSTTAACLESSGTIYYVDSSAPIATGLEIFTDPLLTTRLYLADPLAANRYLWLEDTGGFGFTAAIDFDGSGLVDNVVTCNTVLNPITVTDSSSPDQGCYSCRNFLVSVPEGLTYVVQSISAFDSNANYAGGFCSGGGGTIINSNGAIVINGGVGGSTFQFNAGIEVAEGGGNPLTSTLFINVRLNNVAGAVIQQLVITRNHQAANC